MAVLVASATIAASCNSPSPQPTPTPLPSRVPERPKSAESSDLILRLVEAHNAIRVGKGLTPLVLNPALAASARVQARDMAERRKMSHKGGDGSSPFDRMARQGYSFGSAAENVAAGYEDVESVMSGWMKSPGHRRNILGNFSEIGAARAIGRDDVAYWCVTFGTPSGR